MPITMSHHAPIQRHIPMTEAEQAARVGARQASLARAGANVSRSQAATEQARADLSRQRER